MLIAVDTNIPIDLASGVGGVTDALAVIRRRTKAARLIASPTVNLELAYLSEFVDEPDVKAAARRALRSLWSKWKVDPVNLVPVGHGIVEVIGAKLRSEGLLPAEETHDALILAEAALLGCAVPGCARRSWHQVRTLVRPLDIMMQQWNTLMHEDYHYHSRRPSAAGQGGFPETELFLGGGDRGRP